MGISSEKAAVVAGIPLRAPLKPIYTAGGAAVEDDEATTPTFEGSRIPSKLACPPPPRKPRPTPKKRCNDMFCHGKKEFFVTPVDLESVFIRRNLSC